jgi:hypothetical protein
VCQQAELASPFQQAELASPFQPAELASPFQPAELASPFQPAEMSREAEWNLYSEVGRLPKTEVLPGR